MCEASDEQTRYEHGNIPREVAVFSAEMLSIRGLVDAIGSVVVLETNQSIDVIETVSLTSN